MRPLQNILFVILERSALLRRSFAKAEKDL